MARISKKIKWISTDGLSKGYEQPINAVGGANDTGTMDDSPCRSEVREEAIKGFCAKLRKAGIRYATMWCATSNIFCNSQYVIVDPEEHEKAYEIAKEHEKEAKLFYSCEKLSEDDKC